MLSGDGRVDTIRDPGGETLYRRCRSNAHHHHLTCRGCGRSVEVAGRAVERWADEVAAGAGFTEVDHTVELFGVCPGCVSQDGPSPAARSASPGSLSPASRGDAGP